MTMRMFGGAVAQPRPANIQFRLKCKSARRFDWRLIGSIAIAYGILLPAASSVAQSPPEETSERLDVGDLTYEYKKIPIIDPNTKELEYYSGEILVTNTKRQSIIYREADTLAPGCWKFPTLSTVTVPRSDSLLGGKDFGKGKVLVLLCGSTGGPHQTLKVFGSAGVSLSVASLDFHNTRVNFSYDPDIGAFAAMVLQRGVFTLDQGGESHAFVYRLRLDMNTMGFAPIFGPSVKKYYLKDFEDLVDSNGIEQVAQRPGTAITALMATGDQRLICSKIAELEAAGASRTIIQQWLEAAPLAGYPTFDLEVCGEH